MILIIDFGSQYTQLVARRVRELGVYCEIVPFSKGEERAKSLKSQSQLQGIVLSGGPHSVYASSAPSLGAELLEWNVPLLGICYGLQLINLLSGGTVEAAKFREYGLEKITLTGLKEENPFLSTISGGLENSDGRVWMSHGDEIRTVAPGFYIEAVTSNGSIAAIAHKVRKIYGLQFHPEVEHTPCGAKIIEQFVLNVCGCVRDWSVSSVVERLLTQIKAQTEVFGPEAGVICALSGGVDSTVAAVLAQRAIGERLTCLFIDNGLLRKNEYDEVMNRFKQEFHLNVRGVDASEIFLKRLEGIVDPEHKRKIIGQTFIDVFEDEAKNIPNARFLIQGTLYTDVIESVSLNGTSVTIKSHHNVGGLPEKMNFTLVEPFRELFKDEVRKIGKELRIPAVVLNRHPFPGPGLAIRIISDLTKAKLAVLRDADAILVDELHRQNLYDSVWQAFAVLLPVQSVGVMGDGRTYENVCCIRCVTATDGMTADWAKLPYEFLTRVSSRIISEVRGINRVVYDISSKPPATIEWE